MRLSYIVLVAAVYIFACCDEVFAAKDSQDIAASVTHTDSLDVARGIDNGNRILRGRQEVADDESDDEYNTEEENEERALPKLDVAAEKLMAKAAAKLTRSKSLVNLSKMDDTAFLRAVEGNNLFMFQRIEKMGFNPDKMFLKMKEIGKNAPLKYSQKLLLKHYSVFYKKQYPTWVSEVPRMF
ncbi:hypothetical protein V7S43_012895 [Phytophthora oleae]|uniref:RxLR effector protein n=1 Tax=Phytophthora oleae TaxID=2107226 RepID=A0ABD3F7Y1_9STRA